MSSDQACIDELILRAKQGEEQAIQKLLYMHQWLVRLLAGRICREQISFEELIQAGNLGFLYALGHYEALHGAKLSTYAVPWILGEMRRLIRMTENRAYSLDEPMDEEGLSLYDVFAGSDGMNIPYIDLRMAISRLNKEEQMLICLRYFRDLTQKESAVIMGKSQTQISRIECRALDTLRMMLI